MPERGPKDGPVSVQRIEDRIAVSAITIDDEDHNFMEMSEYNAWRLFGMLAIILGIELPKKIGKEIRI